MQICEEMQKLRYETRDGKGMEIIKEIPIKEFPIIEREFVCPTCQKESQKGCLTKKIVSSHFTDHAFIGDMVCERCARLFSIYPYSYIECDDGIRLLNVRQLKDELCRKQKTPFRFCISTSQKRHLFYRAKINYDSKTFAVNLEMETIYTTVDRMKYLFAFVENLMVLGAGKKAMQDGEIPFAVLAKTGLLPQETLLRELKTSREIQIPLFCGQKLDIKEEDAICNLDLLLRT